VAALKDQVDTLIVIPNDRLLQVVDQRVSLANAFGLADDVLHQGIQAISELITVPGMINLDFADVRAIMKDGGAALMSVGRGHGENRASMAAEGAIANPLLDVTIHGAQGILLNIMGGPDMTLFEVNEAATQVREIAHPDANVIFGAVIDPEMGDEMRISIVAVGFQQGFEAPALLRSVAVQAEPRPAAMRTESHPTTSPVSLVAAPESRDLQVARANDSFTPRMINTDDLDVPTFLRNRLREVK
jgi:cell division protein FtsZ